MKKLFRQFFVRHSAGRKLVNKYFLLRYGSSKKYWEQRYRRNGNSGAGSYGGLANYKAAFLNRFVKDQHVKSIIELGCGDGNQLNLFEFTFYTGLDISKTAIDKCRTLFKGDASKDFYTMDDSERIVKAELAISLDVLYHLVEDIYYEKYLFQLFSLAKHFVIIYAWDVEGLQQMHVRHRKFSAWIQKNIKGWQLMQHVANHVQIGSCDFFIYEKEIEVLDA